jgi:hypothetical protein
MTFCRSFQMKMPSEKILCTKADQSAAVAQTAAAVAAAVAA